MGRGSANGKLVDNFFWYFLNRGSDEEVRILPTPNAFVDYMKQLNIFSIWPLYPWRSASNDYYLVRTLSNRMRNMEAKDSTASTEKGPFVAFVHFFFLHRARAALRRILLRSSEDTPSHRALPPFLPPLRPRATAWGFFLLAICHR